MSTRALVACTEKLFLVDLDSHQIDVVEDHRPEYYGISWPADGSHLCLSHSGLDNASLVTLEDYAHSEKASLSIGPRQTPPFISMPHQILCIDELLVATNTGRNCLTLFRLSDQFYRHHWFNDATWDRISRDNAPGGHLNSLFHQNNRLYVVAHNHKKPSYVLVLDWPDLRLIETIYLDVSGAHNLWINSRGMFVCNTMYGRILDVRTGRTVWDAGDDSLPRGIAGNDKRLWVGDSARAAREGRKFSDGIIHALDPVTWRVTDRIFIPGCGGVHEIRLIDEPDDCHHGFPLRAPVRPDPAATARYEHDVTRLRRQQIDRQAKAALARRLGWTIHNGQPQTLDNSGLSATGENLLIATKAAPLAQNVRVEGTITLPPDAIHQHMSLVARYNGPVDQNMVVALLYRLDTRIRADLWRHSDGDWTLLASEVLPDQTDSFTVAFIADGPELMLIVDNALVLQVTDPLSVFSGLTGIRGLIGKVENWSATELSCVPAASDAT